MEYIDKVFFLVGNDKTDALRNSLIYTSRREAGIVSEGKNIYAVCFAISESSLRED